MKKKYALISVFDKLGLIEFAKNITKLGFSIIASGGTYKYLSDNNIKAIEVKDITGFPEILGGRVKTLHPKIFGGILARTNNKEDLKDLGDNDINPIELVVCNLYPFEKENSIENIDIGGVSLIRAAAKNYEFVNVITSPYQYEEFIKDYDKNSIEYRKELAYLAFKRTSEYDNAIKNFFAEKSVENMNLDFELIQELRYGENPHQTAGLYKFDSDCEFELLNGKELSFNNIADMHSAYNIVSEFIGVNACAVIKHSNPCGVALGTDVEDAFKKALECDPISAFGGIIAFNDEVNTAVAKIMKEIFLEVIIAPDFSKEAVEILSQKKNLRLVKVKTNILEFKNKKILDIKNTKFGALVQTKEDKELDKDSFKVVTKEKPDETMIEDMVFAWKVVKHVKSNAIVVAKDKRTVGIGAGQTSRIASMEIALKQACDEAKDAVVASDGFFPAIDNIQAAAQSRIRGIIQPGGSIKDKDVIEECDKSGIVMITTGIRHFLH